MMAFFLCIVVSVLVFTSLAVVFLMSRAPVVEEEEEELPKTQTASSSHDLLTLEFGKRSEDYHDPPVSA
ncbi:hypothetical protein Q31b_18540 [Novipirellula aureliae]|uniref:Uncharacterized protein n=1 Tax=Novipirellula aureliae TaxID=2527966 RepID=A0A5C6E666_9BACT|nr:hypothetical protein [Novipirellula aureliae]TWU44318.1 hypothetical protein Q31b_18540 [Novipirellula aureliae]